MATVIARRSRKARRCNGCGKQAIRPGGMRLIHTSFPSDDLHSGNKPHQTHECWGCAVRYGRGDLLLAPGKRVSQP